MTDGQRTHDRDDSAVASPCINVCVIEPTRGFCIGCGRTVAEIGDWLSMSDADRTEVIVAARQRLAALSAKA